MVEGTSSICCMHARFMAVGINISSEVALTPCLTSSTTSTTTTSCWLQIYTAYWALYLVAIITYQPRVNVLFSLLARICNRNIQWTLNAQSTNNISPWVRYRFKYVPCGRN